MQKNSHENPLPRNHQKQKWFHLVMTSMTMYFILKFKIDIISYGFSQYRGYTDFGIKLDGFIRVLTWIFN